MLRSWLGPLRLMWCILGMIILLYCLGMTIVANCFFHHQAQGSLLYRQHHVIASTLIGQQFSQDKYFWPRPSLTNYQDDLITPAAIAQKNRRYWHLNPHHLASASQVDPDILLVDAYAQIKRVAKARNISENRLKACMSTYTKNAFLDFGPSRVNVLQLNLGLDSAVDVCHA